MVADLGKNRIFTTNIGQIAGTAIGLTLAFIGFKACDKKPTVLSDAPPVDVPALYVNNANPIEEKAAALKEQYTKEIDLYLDEKINYLLDEIKNYRPTQNVVTNESARAAQQKYVLSQDLVKTLVGIKKGDLNTYITKKTIAREDPARSFKLEVEKFLNQLEIISSTDIGFKTLAEDMKGELKAFLTQFSGSSLNKGGS